MTRGRPFLLQPPFTADRTYLHGADIFDGIVGHIGAAADLRLTLTAASDCAIEVCEADAAPDASDDRCGSVTWLDDGVRRRLRLRRRRDLPIATRVAFDEEALIEGATFDGYSAALPAGTAPLMRRVAAASMHLLGIRCPDDYWAIAEIACTSVPPHGAPASVTLSPLLGGRYWKATAAGPDGVGTMLLARGHPRR